MPSRARLDEFIAVVESRNHAGAIERYYTVDSSMQENTAPPRVGRDALVAHERGALARMSHVYSKAVSSGRPRRHSLDFRADRQIRPGAPVRRGEFAGMAR
jgi:hypothetical protein